MDLNHYIGQYIKVFTRDEEWFVGELRSVRSDEFEFNIISSSKDRRIRNMGTSAVINKDRKKNTGIHTVQAIEILEIEELDLKVQQGITLTLDHVPDILDVAHTTNVESLPKKIEF
ncbi:hypothetical protein [Paenibacillus lemnae]|uniref:Uncharacterized protein n=1 Tax=Paenibacillus lemnae TaxID=1330551 RepID=A0A848MAE6_PAELE|nr:hypothetical protein [Paenibacillus lemnae]NMO97140.1 hypothetical protein [Paenibacillus lemnae]